MKARQRLLREIEGYGIGSQFLANVVLNGCSRPTRKLRGMLTLLRAGYTVTAATFSTTDVMVDGRHVGTVSVLDCPERIPLAGP